MPTVDEQVRDFYGSQALTEERAQDILRRAGHRRKVRRRRQLIAVAALLLVALGAAWVSTLLTSKSLVDRAAAEVAMNHRKDLGVEFAFSSYPELDAALDKLPFALEAPLGERLAGYRLVGGRYCSIQAQLAAQLKVLDPSTGHRATLYVTQLTDELDSLVGTHRAVDQITIDMWQDRGLLYALAEDAAPITETP